MPQAPNEHHDPATYNQRWESMWTKDGEVLKPGQAFDAAGASPALSNLLASGGLDVSGKRVFVPGCGRGYDLVEFVRAGAASVAGLELAPTAQREAEAYIEGQLSQEELARAGVWAADFFRWQHPSGHAFDVGYDYTFMCALHPGMRQDWAAGWARGLAPGGKLVCLAFPIDPARKGQPGPPWYVEPQDYKDLLLPLGFTLEKEEAVPEELSHPGRGGKEALLVFAKA